MQLFNTDGLENIRARLAIIEKSGHSDSIRAAKEDLMTMLRPGGVQQTLPVEDEESDPRRD